jgi:cytochrome c biogenesis protein CcdA
MDIQINGLVSFLAGLLSFLSPCVLGIAPAYVSYITGKRTKESFSPHHSFCGWIFYGFYIHGRRSFFFRNIFDEI